jgi:hypothetical protein
VKTLSSPVTFLFKYIFPFGYLFIFLYSSWYLFDKSANLDRQCVAFLIVCLIFAGYGFLLSFQLKRVRIDEKNVYVSNYLREITVPAANLRNATERGWMLPSTILLEFERETELGDRIRFIPVFLREWEIIADLRKLMRESS